MDSTTEIGTVDIVEEDAAIKDNGLATTAEVATATGTVMNPEEMATAGVRGQREGAGGVEGERVAVSRIDGNRKTVMLENRTGKRFPMVATATARITTWTARGRDWAARGAGIATTEWRRTWRR